MARKIAVLVGAAMGVILFAGAAYAWQDPWQNPEPRPDNWRPWKHSYGLPPAARPWRPIFNHPPGPGRFGRPQWRPPRWRRHRRPGLRWAQYRRWRLGPPDPVIRELRLRLRSRIFAMRAEIQSRHPSRAKIMHLARQINDLRGQIFLRRVQRRLHRRLGHRAMFVPHGRPPGPPPPPPPGFRGGPQGQAGPPPGPPVYRPDRMRHYRALPSGPGLGPKTGGGPQFGPAYRGRNTPGPGTGASTTTDVTKNPKGRSWWEESQQPNKR